MAKKNKITLLKNLSAARKPRHEQFSQNLSELREELKPGKLIDRISRSSKKQAAKAGDKIAEKVSEHPAAILAVGSALLAAILYKPAKSAISRFDDDSDLEEDYELVDLQDCEIGSFEEKQ